MLSPDVNILLYAFRQESEDHPRYRNWLTDLIEDEQPFAISELALSSVVRISTNPRAYRVPSLMQEALGFADQIRTADNAVLLAPGPRHWAIFSSFCRLPGVRGNVVPDAYFAAMAIEHGIEWITADGGFGRFPGLNWRRPF
jgi:uncharacterized protein